MHRRAAEAVIDSSAATGPGTGALAFVRAGRRTVVSRAFAASPLKLLTPRNAGHAAWVYTATYGGGLVDGDTISLAIDVAAGATALMSTQSSTKVYRSPRGIVSRVTARVATDGLFVALPDPLVCFAAANYRQSIEIDLSSGAGLVLLDWMTSGRRARGERWQFTAYQSRISICQDGRLIAYDSVRLNAADGPLLERLGRFNALALVAIVGSPLAAQAATIVTSVGQLPLRRRAAQIIAASPIADVGCLLRIAGTSVEDVGRTIRDYLAFVPPLLGDTPWNRKW